MENKEVRRLSRAAIDDRRARLDDLKNVKRLEVAQEIKEARAFGDISENAEYDAAMDRQARIEYEIVMLEEELAHVVEIDENIDTSVVNVGARVTLHNERDGLTRVYDIVSTSESEPFGRKVQIECSKDPYNEKQGYHAGDIIDFEIPAKLSNESMVGRTILGRQKEESVDIMGKKGALRFKIVNIEKIPDVPRGKIISEELLI